LNGSGNKRVNVPRAYHQADIS